MRILHISSAQALGGGERHLADLVNALCERGHDVHVALKPRSPLSEELTALPKENIHTVRLRNALDVGSALELARIVRRKKIEIVHAHMARDYPLAAYATRRNRSARLVITRHVLFHLNRLHAFTLSHASRVIAVSQAVARTLQQQRIFPARKIVVIHNGVNLKRFDRAALNFKREEFCRSFGINPERLLIGTVGEINRLKGLEDFLRAAAIVTRRFKDAEFVIAGADVSSKGEHRAALERLIKELNLTSRVHLTGWLTDVAPMLNSLNLFVSASHTESFGLAIVEAMAAGAGVVATQTEGAREIIEDGETGLLVEIGNAEALAAALIKLIENESERKRLAAQAREAARSRFSLERMVEATEGVYEGMRDEG